MRDRDSMAFRSMRRWIFAAIRRRGPHVHSISCRSGRGFMASARLFSWAPFELVPGGREGRESGARRVLSVTDNSRTGFRNRR
jgi:hypothetical protein